MIHVLSTKALTPSQKKIFTDAGMAVSDINFIETEPIAIPLPSYVKHAVLSSQNAARCVLDRGIKIDNVYCVGSQTANLLKTAYKIREVCDSSKELSEVIVRNYASEAFTFFSGNISLEDIPKALADNDIECKQINVYKTVLKPQKIEDRWDAILFFSPSGVRSFLECNRIGDSVCVCIGKTTALELNGKAKNVTVSPKAGIDDVLVTAKNLLRND